MDDLYLSHMVEYLDKEVLSLYMIINLKHYLHDENCLLDRSSAIHFHCLLGDILILKLCIWYIQKFPFHF
jgi:hypothetical protein